MILYRVQAVNPCELVQPLMQLWINTPPEHVNGRWFTSDPRALPFYIKRNFMSMKSRSIILSVDIPDCIAEVYNVVNSKNKDVVKASHMWGSEFVLPKYWCNKATKTTLLEALNA